MESDRIMSQVPKRTQPAIGARTAKSARPQTTEPPDSAARAQDAAALRHRAEALLREKSATQPESLTPPVTPEATQVMLHELQVHQMELEMQNEELRRNQAELDTARARYFDLYDLAPVGYCTLNVNGMILEANLTLETRLDVKRRALVAKPFPRFIFKEDQDIFYHFRQRLLATEERQTCELRMAPVAGATFWAELAATAIPVLGGSPETRVVVSDITERKRAEEALRVERENLAAIFEASPVAMFILDETTNIIQCNPAAAILAKGGTADVLEHRLGNALRCVHSSEDPRGCGYSAECLVCPLGNSIRALIATGGTVSETELSVELFRDGTFQQVWVKVGAGPVLLNGRRHLCVALEDITARKQTAARLVLQLDELERWQAVTLDREDRVQELKREVNELCHRSGAAGRYPSQELVAPDAAASKQAV